MMSFKPLFLALVVGGCSSPFGRSLPQSAYYGGTPPLVTARENATSSLTLIACPLRPEGGALMSEMIQSLSQQSPVVTSSEAGTARLIINLCPNAPTAEVVREIARMRGVR